MGLGQRSLDVVRWLNDWRRRICPSGWTCLRVAAWVFLAAGLLFRALRMQGWL